MVRVSARLEDLPSSLENLLRPDLRGLTPYGAPQAPLPVPVADVAVSITRRKPA